MGRGVIAGFVALGVLLFASVAVNVFILGHLSGRMLAGPMFSGHRPPPIERDHRSGQFEDPFRIMRYADELSPELRDSFREAFREQLPALREEYRAMRGLRRELGALMSAEVWDSAAIGAKLQEIRAAQDRQHDAFNSAFMSAFETLPAAERKRLIDAANERRKEHRKRIKFGGGEGPPPPSGEGGPPPPEEED
jgi:uncharacterized membrane protein